MILQIKRGNRVIAESADFSYSPSLQEVRKLTCEVVSVVPIEFKAYNSKSESEYDTVVYNGNTFSPPIFTALSPQPHREIILTKQENTNTPFCFTVRRCFCRMWHFLT